MKIALQEKWTVHTTLAACLLNAPSKVPSLLKGTPKKCPPTSYSIVMLNQGTDTLVSDFSLVGSDLKWDERAIQYVQFIFIFSNVKNVILYVFPFWTARIFWPLFVPATPYHLITSLQWTVVFKVSIVNVYATTNDWLLKWQFCNILLFACDIQNCYRQWREGD